jgi:hypothetical protein
MRLGEIAVALTLASCAHPDYWQTHHAEVWDKTGRVSPVDVDTIVEYSTTGNLDGLKIVFADLKDIPCAGHRGCIKRGGEYGRGLVFVGVDNMCLPHTSLAHEIYHYLHPECDSDECADLDEIKFVNSRSAALSPACREFMAGGF